MQGNGHADDFGFEWIWRRRLQMLEADGSNPDDVKHLTSKVQMIASALQSFRTQHKALKDSGKYTEAGLAAEAAAIASTTAGVNRNGIQLSCNPFCTSS